MKSFLLALAITAAALFTTVPAEAGFRYGHPHAGYNHCKPKVYKVRTCEIDRCSYKKWAYDHCGKRYSYLVTVITYKDIYSNGTYKIWKRTIS